jgi:hypothetical protein
VTTYDVYGARREAEAMQDTWGHLAGDKGRAYGGHFLFALGCFGDLAVIEVEFADLPDSPWLYEHLHDWIWDHKPEEGRIYRFDGTYQCDRADRFVGDLRPAEATR